MLVVSPPTPPHPSSLRSNPNNNSSSPSTTPTSSQGYTNSASNSPPPNITSSLPRRSSISPVVSQENSFTTATNINNNIINNINKRSPSPESSRLLLNNNNNFCNRSSPTSATSPVLDVGVVNSLLLLKQQQLLKQQLQQQISPPLPSTITSTIPSIGALSSSTVNIAALSSAVCNNNSSNSVTQQQIHEYQLQQQQMLHAAYHRQHKQQQQQQQQHYSHYYSPKGEILNNSSSNNSSSDSHVTATTPSTYQSNTTPTAPSMPDPPYPPTPTPTVSTVSTNSTSTTPTITNNTNNSTPPLTTPPNSNTSTSTAGGGAASTGATSSTGGACASAAAAASGSNIGAHHPLLGYVPHGANKILSRNLNGTLAVTTQPSNESELQLYRVLQRANLLTYYDVFISQGRVKGGDDVQQLCEAGEEEFLEIMALVGMATKPLHVRRLQKALQEWVTNPREFNPSTSGAGVADSGRVGGFPFNVASGSFHSQGAAEMVSSGVSALKSPSLGDSNKASISDFRVSAGIPYEPYSPNIDCGSRGTIKNKNSIKTDIKPNTALDGAPSSSKCSPYSMFSGSATSPDEFKLGATGRSSYNSHNNGTFKPNKNNSGPLITPHSYSQHILVNKSTHSNDQSNLGNVKTVPRNLSNSYDIIVVKSPLSSSESKRHHQDKKNSDMYVDVEGVHSSTNKSVISKPKLNYHEMYYPYDKVLSNKKLLSNQTIKNIVEFNEMLSPKERILNRALKESSFLSNSQNSHLEGNSNDNGESSSPDTSLVTSFSKEGGDIDKYNLNGQYNLRKRKIPNSPNKDKMDRMPKLQRVHPNYIQNFTSKLHTDSEPISIGNETISSSSAINNRAYSPHSLMSEYSRNYEIQCDSNSSIDITSDSIKYETNSSTSRKNIVCENNLVPLNTNRSATNSVPLSSKYVQPVHLPNSEKNSVFQMWEGILKRMGKSDGLRGIDLETIQKLNMSEAIKNKLSPSPRTQSPESGTDVRSHSI